MPLAFVSQIDGTTNPSIDSVFFPDMPIRTARFTGDGSQIVCSGRRPFIYTFDVTTGKASKVDRIIGTLLRFGKDTRLDVEFSWFVLSFVRRSSREEPGKVCCVP